MCIIQPPLATNELTSKPKINRIAEVCPLYHWERKRRSKKASYFNTALSTPFLLNPTTVHVFQAVSRKET